MATRPRPTLWMREQVPENQETPVHFTGDWITPVEHFYRRNHFAYPDPAPQASVSVEGRVRAPRVFGLDELRAMPSKRLVCVLECAGSRRANFNPRTFGVQWEDGALSQGEWKGVPLKRLLDEVGLEPGAAEIVFEGADRGPRRDRPGEVPFARSLPVSRALDEEVLVAYELNGEPLPFEHGHPLRLMVPGWYGMASVKWLRRIVASDVAFDGPFQAVDYHYYPRADDDSGKTPVTSMKLNSIIQQPLDRAQLRVGTVRVEGIAWTGEGAITGVEVSFDGGRDWHPAALRQDPAQPRAWTLWAFEWAIPGKGEYTLAARAKDSLGRVQAQMARWNRKGYGYDAMPMITVEAG